MDSPAIYNNMTTRIFINWTTEDFTHTWAGTEYTFKAGDKTILEEALAIHFAKHLADRELNNAGLSTGTYDPDRGIEKGSPKGDYMLKALGETVAEEGDKNVLIMKTLNAEVAKEVKESDEINPEFVEKPKKVKNEVTQ